MPDFSKIWATDSPLPAYTFTDSEYLTGWDFVAAAPPTKNQFDAWFQLTDQKLKWLYDKLNDTANAIYPVGSVYISFDSTSPSSLFGGTWQRLKDTFLLANGDIYAANTTGGSATKTIAVTNMPAHNHTVNSAGAHAHTATTANNGAHNHTASSASAGAHVHTASSASAGAHAHTATIATDGAHTHTATTASAGAHTHKRGTMNIVGKFSGVGNIGTSDEATLNGAFYRVNTASNPSQGVKVRNDGGEKDDYFGFDASRSGAWTGETSENGAHTHTVSVKTTDSKHTHSITINSNGAHTHGITVNSNGAHTHNITVNSSGTHNHSVTVNSNGAHTHTTNNTGGSQPLNILPPYTTVYMWRRTA